MVSDMAGVWSSRDFVVTVSMLEATSLAGIAEATAARPATMIDPKRMLMTLVSEGLIKRTL